MSAQRARQRRKQEPVAPAVGRRADEARDRHRAILQLTNKVREPHRGHERLRRLAPRDLGHVVGHEIRIDARRLVARGSPARIGLDRLAAEELKRLGARFVAQGLALQVSGDREDFEPARLGLGHALAGVGFGAGVVGAASEVELPARFFPAIEPGGGNPIEPFIFRHVAKLAANESDLMIRVLSRPMLFRLVVAHRGLSPGGIGSELGGYAGNRTAGRRAWHAPPRAPPAGQATPAMGVELGILAGGLATQQPLAIARRDGRRDGTFSEPAPMIS